MLVLPEPNHRFHEGIQRQRIPIYTVGGVVRDLCHGEKAATDGNDWDFTTNATPEEILKLFPTIRFITIRMEP